jgi:hypothetical protein
MASFREYILEHHLSDPTRAARRNLLIISIISYLLIKGKLVPAKVDFLGLTIGDLQRDTLLRVLLALASYYLVKFYLYMFTDGQVQLYKAYSALAVTDATMTWERYKATLKSRVSHITAYVGIRDLLLVIGRGFFDSTLPVFVGIYVVAILFSAL